jgi:3-isopropylmalate dehydratase small subunit
MGLPIFESKAIYGLINEGDEIEVDGDAGVITISGRETGPIKIEPVPPFMQELVAAGGLLPYLVKKRAGG